jgi:Zn-dependent M28 family amino/carboxypeptidase
MPGKPYSGPLSPLSNEEITIRDHLEEHVKKLAGEIGERNFWHYEALGKAALYIEEAFQKLGYQVLTQEFLVKGKAMNNIEVQLSGVSFPGEIVLVGAHYDSVLGSPGANDNATGTAAVLEIARLLQDRKLARTVHFVAFANEEPPFFYTKLMGSRAYARRSRERGEQIIAMLSIETIGYYSDQEGSQRYPFPFNFFYPSTANFIGFVGNISSRDLVYRCIAAFRQHTAFPSEGVSAPGWITGIGWSDQWSFWKEGYPAIMVTDTALYRYDEYHTTEDTPDKIDFARTARVVAGLAKMVAELSGPVVQ